MIERQRWEGDELPVRLHSFEPFVFEVPGRVGPCVYILCRGEAVVYVGRASCLYTRLCRHRKKDFDRAFYIPCPPNRMGDMEFALINLFSPELNKVYKNNGIMGEEAVQKLLMEFAHIRRSKLAQIMPWPNGHPQSL